MPTDSNAESRGGRGSLRIHNGMDQMPTPSASESSRAGGAT
jgi:hypothetical protein